MDFILTTLVILEVKASLLLLLSRLGLLKARRMPRPDLEVVTPVALCIRG